MASHAATCDRIALVGGVLSIVTAETAREICVATVVCVHVPRQVHRREDGDVVDLLKGLDRLLDLPGLGGVHLRVV